jgi:hypothetical protein
MKLLFFSALVFITTSAFSQNIQLHWDFRHTFDPKTNVKNFPDLNFEYFKELDTAGTGTFMIKLDSRLDGVKSNVGQVFTQISQSIKFWKPRTYLSVTYSGGLGVTPNSFGYYLTNSFGIGPAWSFQLKGAWVSVSTYFRVTEFKMPSYDPQVTLWFGKGFFNYKIYLAGSFVLWSENRNQGNEATKDLKGKKIAFFGDPQIWFKIKNSFSVGSKINVYYHLLTPDNHVQAYPTLGLKYQF